MGGGDDLQIVILLKNECSFSGTLCTWRWWGHKSFSIISSFLALELELVLVLELELELELAIELELVLELELELVLELELEVVLALG